MSTTELLILAIGLSMDAFAVSICRGLSMKKVTIGTSIEAGLYFGGFQALMPVIGYVAGYRFADAISSFDHWIAFILLGAIGFNMIKESFSKDDDEGEKSQSMLTMAIATSIDALAVGISLALLNINIIVAASFIGIVTFCFSFAGVKIGAIFGDKFKSKAELAGGLILVAIGLKILLEHTIMS